MIYYCDYITVTTLYLYLIILIFYLLGYVRISTSRVFIQFENSLKLFVSLPLHTLTPICNCQFLRVVKNLVSPVTVTSDERSVTWNTFFG